MCTRRKCLLHYAYKYRGLKVRLPSKGGLTLYILSGLSYSKNLKISYRSTIWTPSAPDDVGVFLCQCALSFKSSMMVMTLKKQQCLVRAWWRFRNLRNPTDRSGDSFAAEKLEKIDTGNAYVPAKMMTTSYLWRWDAWYVLDERVFRVWPPPHGKYRCPKSKESSAMLSIMFNSNVERGVK